MERKDAIEVVKKNLPESGFTMLREALETLIPELKESENERIRKVLTEHIKGITSWNYFLGISKEQMITWLEKQGEQTHWKPSEEQMQHLHKELIEGSVTFLEDVRVLSSLYEDLRKLN